MSKRYEAVFYDFDGTIADSVPVILMCFRLAYERVFGRCDRTDEDFMQYIGRPLEDTFEMHGEKLQDLLTKTYLDINEKMLRNDEIDLFDGVIDDIRYLRSLGIKQGIITSKRKTSCMTTVELKGIADLFDVMIFREDTDRHKPDGEPILCAMERLGIDDPSKVVYVGDALPDMLCAKNAGVKFVLVDWTKMPSEEMRNDPGTTVVSRIRDIVH